MRHQRDCIFYETRWMREHIKELKDGCTTNSNKNRLKNHGRTSNDTLHTNAVKVNKLVLIVWLCLAAYVIGFFALGIYKLHKWVARTEVSR